MTMCLPDVDDDDDENDDEDDNDDDDDVPGDGPGVRVVEDGQSCPELLVRVGVWNKTNVRHVGLHRTLI